mmetsp:Transcript_34156/g.101493  ORF Transcript_34156/g.101493 Transcript_34156/m.101493 type:complete len:338 (+) Transcript_34156:766-1779(+)
MRLVTHNREVSSTSRQHQPAAPASSTSWRDDSLATHSLTRDPQPRGLGTPPATAVPSRARPAHEGLHHEAPVAAALLLGPARGRRRHHHALPRRRRRRRAQRRGPAPRRQRQAGDGRRRAAVAPAAGLGRRGEAGRVGLHDGPLAAQGRGGQARRAAQRRASPLAARPLGGRALLVGVVRRPPRGRRRGRRERRGRLFFDAAPTDASPLILVTRDQWMSSLGRVRRRRGRAAHRRRRPQRQHRDVEVAPRHGWRGGRQGAGAGRAAEAAERDGVGGRVLLPSARVAQAGALSRPHAADLRCGGRRAGWKGAARRVRERRQVHPRHGSRSCREYFVEC